MTDIKSNQLPPDSEARTKALDIEQSFIVQAPAGSGKTELLIQRILSLLARVERPEEVLAITFTRKAAGEMKERLIKALERACENTPPEEGHERVTWERAVNALARDAAMGWNIRSNPSRLQIMTIDSFCSGLSRRMPWLTRLGDQPGVSEDPEKLYRQAAESFLAIVDSSGAEQEPVSRVLQHLDNRLDHLCDLLVRMLGKRDQWIRHVIGQRVNQREVLENALKSYVRSVLSITYDAIGESMLSEAQYLGQYAAQNLEDMGIDSPLSCLLDGQQFDPLEPDHLGKWLALCHLVLTSSGTLRKSVNKNIGFTVDKSGDAPAWKDRMQQLLGNIEAMELVERLERLRNLPSALYDDSQWHVLEALIQLLPLVVVELRSVFRQTGTVDFIEVAGAALAGLGATDNPGDLLLKLDSTISHILVDEFQDTSYAQYELLRKLTSGWQRGDGRTLFVVGDPMQSIYLFREADVGLFLRVCREGLGDIELIPLTLTANFRSQKPLIVWFNEIFSQLFPQIENSLTGAVNYTKAGAVRTHSEEVAATCHLFCDRQDQNEAELILELIQQAKDDFPEGTCAILVRSRTHLNEIVKLLNEYNVSYQAQDVDPLGNRPVVSDLLALTRAILYPCDRIAWMAVLRAPWCGLELADLLLLAAHDKRVSVLEHLDKSSQQQEMFSVLSQDGEKRLGRVLPVLMEARSSRGQFTLTRLVESTWLRLGGPACVDAQGLDDATQFFKVLQAMEEGGDLLSVPELSRKLEDLFAAPDPQAGDSLQIMTIHKAKGLEFDTVILPGLGRGVQHNEKQLLRWLEHPEFELMLAPIPALGGEDDVTYKSIGTILQQRECNETLRLLYVAATRARERLTLLGHVKEGKNGPVPAAGSLLHALWPALANNPPELIISEHDDEVLKPDPSIRRLPPVFNVPVPAGRVAADGLAIARASETANNSGERNTFSLRSQEGRIVGTVVHQWMERFTRDGIDSWQGEKNTLLRQRIDAQLSSLGIPRTRLAECTDKVLECLKKVFSSEKALWLVGDRDQGKCELSLSGIIDGKLMHASIDRTFVDKDIRWIVDYKTTTPNDGESLNDFLAREAEKYGPQLSAYIQLITAVDTSNTVKGALYFPAIDAWKEVS